MNSTFAFQSNGSFIVLYTTLISKTREFYQELGVEITESTEEKVVVRFGGFDLHFILNTTEPFEEYRYIAAPTMYGQGLILYLPVDDLLQAKMAIEKGGGVIKADIFENHWGCRELLFEDPNGYKIALYQEK